MIKMVGLKLFVGVVALLQAAVWATDPCSDEEYLEGLRAKYMITDKKLQYPGYLPDGVKAKCDGTDGYRLVTIKNEQKNKELFDFASCVYAEGKKFNKFTGFWVGGMTKDVTLGTEGWAWTDDGTLFKDSYANWEPSLPQIYLYPK